jgi:hypothetical protein
MLIYWLMLLAFAAAAMLYRPSQAVPQAAAPAPAPHLAQGPRVAPARSLASEIVAILLIFLIGLRYHVGGDWNNYDVTYRVIERLDLFEALTSAKTEIGFTFINWLSSRLGTGIWLVNLICAIPFGWGLMRLCKQQPNPWLSFVVATPFLIIVVGMGFTRQAVAIGFLMLGVSSYIRTGSLVSFVWFVLCGALFHKTVLIFIPIIYLAHGRNKLVSLGLTVISVGLAYFTVFRDTVEMYGQGYLAGRYDAAGATVRILMNIVPAVLLLVSRDRLYRSREEKVVWKTFAILALMAGAALPLISSSVVVDRLAMYLIPLQLVVLGRVHMVFSKKATSSGAWSLLVTLYSATVLYVWLNYSHYASGWIPYQSFLSPP